MKPEKILILEEDRETNQLLSQSLSKTAFSLDFSMEQAATLFKITCINYSIIFLNPCLPQLDARKIISKLNEIGSKASLILIGDLREKDRLLSSFGGLTLCCLYKPLNSQEVTLVAEKALEMRKLKEDMNSLQARLEIFKNPNHMIYSSDQEYANMSIEDIFEKRLGDFVNKMCMLEKCDLFDIIFPRLEKRLMEMVLKETGGNQIKAASILGISRNTLRKKTRGQ